MKREVINDCNPCHVTAFKRARFENEKNRFLQSVDILYMNGFLTIKQRDTLNKKINMRKD